MSTDSGPLYYQNLSAKAFAPVTPQLSTNMLCGIAARHSSLSSWTIDGASALRTAAGKGAESPGVETG